MVSKSSQSGRRDYFLGQSGAKPKSTVVWVTQLFPLLETVSCFPTVVTGYKISCSLHQLNIFPPLALVACFPALDAGFIFPPFHTCFPVLYAAYMFSRHWRCLRVFVLGNGLVFSRRHYQSHDFTQTPDWFISLFVYVAIVFYISRLTLMRDIRKRSVFRSH